MTKPLEDSIAGIDGVDVITPISRAEQGQITVRFRLEKDDDAAAAEVRDRTSRVRNRLPQAIEEPVISKVEADAFPVIQVGFSSDSLSALQINDLVNRIVKPRLQTVTGVADVRIFGERKYAMRVWLDPDKMAAYRLASQDVEDAIRRSNLELPAGRIESRQREFTVTSQTNLVRPGQFGDIVIKNVNGFSVKVRESVSPRELNHFGQRRSVSITASLSGDYSLGEAINFMNETAGKVLKTGYSTDLNGTSREFKKSQGALAIVFVLALVFIFLVLAAQFESFVDPLVIMLSVPLSMIGALMALKWSGGSLNV